MSSEIELEKIRAEFEVKKAQMQIDANRQLLMDMSASQSASNEKMIAQIMAHSSDQNSKVLQTVMEQMNANTQLLIQFIGKK